MIEEYVLMSIREQIDERIRRFPGILEHELAAVFGLTPYRLHRVFRQIERDLDGETLVCDPTNGVWCVAVDSSRCIGMVWRGQNAGGYEQCINDQQFDDGRCYDHSRCQNPEMIHFARKLAYLAGPSEPNAHSLGQLTLPVVEDLIALLESLTPWTRHDRLTKMRYMRSLAHALAFLRWKDRMRRVRRDNGIPPEFERRHRESSINPFEFGIKKHFAVLEVTPEATREQVLKAWRNLAKRFHPDAPDGNEERMKAVNLAKERIFLIRRWD